LPPSARRNRFTGTSSCANPAPAVDRVLPVPDLRCSDWLTRRTAGAGRQEPSASPGSIGVKSWK
jgi:hypothetical protein